MGAGGNENSPAGVKFIIGGRTYSKSSNNMLIRADDDDPGGEAGYYDSAQMALNTQGKRGNKKRASTPQGTDASNMRYSASAEGFDEYTFGDFNEKGFSATSAYNLIYARDGGGADTAPEQHGYDETGQAAGIEASEGHIYQASVSVEPVHIDGEALLAGPQEMPLKRTSLRYTFGMASYSPDAGVDTGTGSWVGKAGKDGKLESKEENSGGQVLADGNPLVSAPEISKGDSALAPRALGNGAFKMVAAGKRAWSAASGNIRVDVNIRNVSSASMGAFVPMDTALAQAVAIKPAEDSWARRRIGYAIGKGEGGRPPGASLGGSGASGGVTVSSSGADAYDYPYKKEFLDKSKLRKFPYQYGKPYNSFQTENGNPGSSEPSFGEEHLLGAEPFFERNPLPERDTLLETDPLLERDTLLETDPLLERDTLLETDPLLERSILPETDPLFGRHLLPEMDPLFDTDGNVFGKNPYRLVRGKLHGNIMTAEAPHSILEQAGGSAALAGLVLLDTDDANAAWGDGDAGGDLPFGMTADDLNLPTATRIDGEGAPGDGGEDDDAAPVIHTMVKQGIQTSVASGGLFGAAGLQTAVTGLIKTGFSSAMGLLPGRGGAGAVNSGYMDSWKAPRYQEAQQSSKSVETPVDESEGMDKSPVSKAMESMRGLGLKGLLPLAAIASLVVGASSIVSGPVSTLGAAFGGFFYHVKGDGTKYKVQIEEKVDASTGAVIDAGFLNNNGWVNIEPNYSYSGAPYFMDFTDYDELSMRGDLVSEYIKSEISYLQGVIPDDDTGDGGIYNYAYLNGNRIKTTMEDEDVNTIIKNFYQQGPYDSTYVTKYVLPFLNMMAFKGYMLELTEAQERDIVENVIFNPQKLLLTSIRETDLGSDSLPGLDVTISLDGIHQLLNNYFVNEIDNNALSGNVKELENVKNYYDLCLKYMCETENKYPMALGLPSEISANDKEVLLFKPAASASDGISKFIKTAIKEIGHSSATHSLGYSTNGEWGVRFVQYCAPSGAYIIASANAGAMAGSYKAIAAADPYAYPPIWQTGGPAAGKLIFFDWDGDDEADRVGIVIGVNYPYVYAVEGNNGDKVRLMRYSAKDKAIYGYANLF